MTNKKGMTLVELLIYMVLAALLLAPVIMLMKNSSVNMARDASNTNLRMTGREILNIIYDDLKNTGYKLNPSDYTAKSEVTYYTASVKDSSSFIHSKVSGNTLYDTLTVRVGRLNSDGTAWVKVDTISYYVVDLSGKKSLTRRLKNDNSTVTLAQNVQALRFRYSPDLVEWYDSFTSTAADLKKKKNVQYIKVILALKDDKKLSPTKTAVPITLIKAGDGGTGVTEVKITPTDAALYERHEIVVPVPNNGVFP